MRYGINLWGVWNLLSADPAGFCGKVREMGYQYLEPCITVGRGIEGLPQFMDEEALTQFINTAKAHDLKVEAAHVAVTDEANAVQNMLKQAAIAFENVPMPEDAASALDCLPFDDYLISANVSLKKGANVLRLITKNSVPMDGTTLEAAAPIVDCVKIETEGVVIWDANRGLPASNY